MSYRIEYKKKVVHVQAPESDERFRTFKHLFLFLSSGCDNNVSPRRPDWSLHAIDFSFEAKHEWGGEVMIPKCLWEAAQAADGGMIQPHNRQTTGVRYIQAWKKAAKEAVDLPLTDYLPWSPTLRVCGLLADGTLPLKEHVFADTALEMEAAFQRFPWRKTSRSCECVVRTKQQLLDAIFLVQHASSATTTDIYLSDNPGSPFLEA